MKGGSQAGAAARWRFDWIAPEGVDEVLAIEQRVYGFPWTRGNFLDSLAAGHLLEGLRPAEAAPQAGLRGYYVAMPGVQEMHLLNLSVAPDWQGRGLAGLLLDRVLERCAEQSARQLWLEVRVGNERARRLYRRRGFDEVGLRPRYYPAAAGAREDALVMKLEVPAHALG